MREYQANDGTTKSALELNATILDLVGKKGDNPQSSQAATQSVPPQPTRVHDNFDPEDDIPF
jgi:single-strand DNA-binding protein